MDLQATHGSKTAGIVYARGLLQGKGEILSTLRNGSGRVEIFQPDLNLNPT